MQVVSHFEFLNFSLYRRGGGSSEAPPASITKAILWVRGK